MVGGHYMEHVVVVVGVHACEALMMVYHCHGEDGLPMRKEEWFPPVI